MLNAALAFLPLLSGYIFVTTWYQTRYLIQREDSQKVYFRAAFWGIWLFLLSFSLVSRFKPELAPVLGFLNSWHEQAILTDGKAARIDLMFWVMALALTLLLGIFGGYLLNWLFAFWAIPLREVVRLMIRVARGRDTALLSYIYDFSRRAAVKRAIYALNSDLDIVLLRAMQENMPVSVSLGHGKVYVGYVTGSIEPGEKREMLRILPLVSGYRDGDAMKLKFTTWYVSIYEQFNEQGLSHLRPELFEVVVPLADIKSVNLFDINAYNAFQQAPAA